LRGRGEKDNLEETPWKTTEVDERRGGRGNGKLQGCKIRKTTGKHCGGGGNLKKNEKTKKKRKTTAQEGGDPHTKAENRRKGISNQVKATKEQDWREGNDGGSIK